MFECLEKFYSPLPWQAEAIYDDVVITGPGVPGATPVKPQGKLATIWSQIKLMY